MEAVLSVAATNPGLMLAVFSLGFTVAHTVEEMGAIGEPFWDYVAPLTRVAVPHFVGVLLFVGLAAALAALAAVGYVYQNAFALALLMGLRAGDALGSHVVLNWLYAQENPGLSTIPVYAGELLLVGLLWRDIQPDAFRADAFAAGFLFFVLPWTLLLIRWRLARR